jgi:hypothetical protein
LSIMSWQLTTLPACLNSSRTWPSVVLCDRLPTYSFVAIISFCCGRRPQWKFPMDSGFRLSPSKHARLIIYQSHCERLLSVSRVDNMPGSHKSNDKVHNVRPRQFPPPSATEASVAIPAIGHVAVESRGWCCSRDQKASLDSPMFFPVASFLPPNSAQIGKTV